MRTSMPMVELGSFGNRLKALRHAKGISQADLARLIGFDGLLRQHQAAVDTRFALSGRAGIEGKEGQQHGDQRDARQDQRAAAQAAR